jgi:hypothetical protein
MSTYIIGYVVGDFDFAECVDAEGTLIRVYTPVQKANQGVFAAKVQKLSSSFKLCVLLPDSKLTG